MKQDAQWWMPDDENHLPDHMRTVNRKVNGRLTYQFAKYGLAKAHIKEFRNVIDVGSHIGLWAWFMASDFENVLAFEPMEEHRDCWAKNMEGIRNAGMYPYALGHKESMVAVECRTPGSSGDTQVVVNKPGDIEMRTLDSFAFQDVDLIKIDCEGFEEFVLRGGVETLERCKPCVIVEQKRDMSARYGLEKQSAVKFLQDMGAVLRGEMCGDYILSWD